VPLVSGETSWRGGVARRVGWGWWRHVRWGRCRGGRDRRVVV